MTSDYIELVATEVGLFSESNRRQCFLVNITDDSIFESSENFFVAMNVTMGTTMVTVRPDRARATVVIADNDGKSYLTSIVWYK